MYITLYLGIKIVQWKGGEAIKLNDCTKFKMRSTCEMLMELSRKLLLNALLNWFKWFDAIQNIDNAIVPIYLHVSMIFFLKSSFY